jgi:hypothetical protein
VKLPVAVSVVDFVDAAEVNAILNIYLFCDYYINIRKLIKFV